MPRKVPSPTGSLQYSFPPMEYPRNSARNPAASSSPAYIRNGELGLSLAPTQKRRIRLRKLVAKRKVGALLLVSRSPGGGNGDWREGYQGRPGGGAASAPGRGSAPAPRGALRRTVAVRVCI
jgi:hypothetical protein